MAKVTTYKNSKLATFCSAVGYLCIAAGVYMLFHDEPGVGVIAVALGFVFKFLGVFISKKKNEKDAKRNQNV